MKIQKIIYEDRRDFKAIFECQFCGYTEKLWGYDDLNFHHNVIPDMKCKKCNKSINENVDELNEKYRPQTTKYPEGLQL